MQLTLNVREARLECYDGQFKDPWNRQTRRVFGTVSGFRVDRVVVIVIFFLANQRVKFCTQANPSFFSLLRQGPPQTPSLFFSSLVYLVSLDCGVILLLSPPLNKGRSRYLSLRLAAKHSTLAGAPCAQTSTTILLVLTLLCKNHVNFRERERAQFLYYTLKWTTIQAPI